MGRRPELSLPGEDRVPDDVYAHVLPFGPIHDCEVRGVDVQYPPVVSRQDGLGRHAHVPREGDDVYPVGLYRLDDKPVELRAKCEVASPLNTPLPVEVPDVDALVGYPMLIGDVLGPASLTPVPLHPVVPDIGEDEGDLVARVGLLGSCDDLPGVRARPRDEAGDPHLRPLLRRVDLSRFHVCYSRATSI